MDQDEVPAFGALGRAYLGRRSVLKKSAVAAGVAWTAPVVISLHDPVLAAVGSGNDGDFTFCWDNGANEGWTIDNTAGPGANGHWGLDSSRSVSGTTSMHYGRGSASDYNSPNNTRNSGTVTSPSFTVNTTGNQDLVFQVWREVETYGSGNWDQFSVSVAGGATLYSVARDGGTGGVWQQVTVSLAAYAGTSIQLVMAFDTGDGNFNNYEGVYVDDFKVPSQTPPATGLGFAGRARISTGPSGFFPERTDPTKKEQRRRDRDTNGANPWT
ncbi:MAG: hypothetical protein HKN94_13850 [Acidimicrobiales bacterium]|nr:hypothetical protein [Acidimicrobiales bacterium]RZV44445.1 MAG: hypothetical protein EX269_11730 [Acidimicrobiales bacterium]